MRGCRRIGRGRRSAGAFEVANRFVCARAIFQQGAEIIVGLGEAQVDDDRAVEAIERLVRAPEIVDDVAEVVVKARVLGGAWSMDLRLWVTASSCRPIRYNATPSR